MRKPRKKRAAKRQRKQFATYADKLFIDQLRYAVKNHA